ncbi:MAG: serine/threonine-protein kinase [Candidatus Melainabacteria bacterium]|nr:serine/threonine-protein kinase [Candidatus Melainabacteria bacterium]
MQKDKNEVLTCVPEDYSKLGKNSLIILIPALYIYSILLINHSYLAIFNKHQAFAWAILAIFISGTILFINYRRQHRLLNILAITERGLSIGRMEDSAFESVDYVINWKEITSVEERGKPDSNGHFRQWFIINSSLNVSFKLTSANAFRWVSREEIIESLIKYAPEAELHLTLPDNFETSHMLRYTNLWLESLDNAGKRLRTDILDSGDNLANGLYTVTRQLGAGGQGRAYLAKRNTKNVDLDASEIVVLKEYILPTKIDAINNENAEPPVHKSEATILAKLNHPGVVKLLDCFEEDHRGYLVLEFVVGTPIHDLVSMHGSFSEAKAREIAISLCQVMAYMHSFSPAIIHGDITPENLILKEDGSVCVIDFTIAHFYSKERKLKVCGKNGYVAPEQYAGYDSPQSDIYSIGCTLYFMLTALDCETLTQPTITNQSQETIASEAMKRILAKATASDVDQRYIDCVALEADLASLRY